MPDDTQDATGRQLPVWYRDYAPLLITNGYSPLPVKGKKPFHHGWQNKPPDPVDLDFNAGANVGIRTRDCPALDVDILDPDTAQTLLDRLSERFPFLKDCPRRYGRWPKFLWVMRTSKPFRKHRIKLYRLVDDRFATLEFLGDGQQFVAYGPHPDTHKPYNWNGAGEPITVPREKLPEIDEAQALEILRYAEEVLRELGYAEFRSERPEGPKGAQGILLDFVQAALLALDDDVPESVQQSLLRLSSDDRDQWIRVGLLLRAFADQGAEWDARGAWVAWSQRSDAYQDGDEDRWDGFKPTGISNPDFALRSLAGLLERPEEGFEVEVPPPPPPPTDIMDCATVLEEEHADFGFVIPGLVPRGVPTLFSAHGGTGKSYINLQAVVSKAAGKEFLGRQLEPGRVLLFSCEEPEKELRIRLRRVLRHLKLKWSDLGGRLTILNGYGKSNNILFSGDRDPEKRLTGAYWKLLEYCKATKPDLVVIDNISEVYDGSEIDRAMVRQFVQSMNAICKWIDCGLILVGHVDAATSTGKWAKGYSGSTAWHNSVRSRLFMRTSEVPGQVILEPSKSNYGPPQEIMVLKFDPEEKVFVMTGTMEQKKVVAVPEDTVLQVLAAIGRIEDAGKILPNTASGPKNGIGMLATEAELPKAEVRSALDRIFLDELAHDVEYPKNDRHVATKIVLTEAGRRQMVTIATGMEIERPFHPIVDLPIATAGEKVVDSQRGQSLESEEAKGPKAAKGQRAKGSDLGYLD